MANVTSAAGLSGLPLEFLNHKWPASVAVLVFSLIALFVKATWQPSYPKGAPTVVREWPIFGALRLFNERKSFYVEASGRSSTGNFSTYVGKYQVLGLSGSEARKLFFESRALSMSEGYAVLFTASPSVDKTKDSNVENFSTWMIRNLTRLLQRDKFVRCLSLLSSDTSSALDRIVERDGKAGTGTFDPFDDIYKIVYRMTMRTLGATEVANDTALLYKTLHLFEEVERGSSPLRIIFPWLPTLGWIRQTVGGARLYAIFDSIAKKRQAEGRKEDDPFQYLLDTGVNMTNVLAFILGGLFAGLVNSGVNSAWLLVYLSTNREWYQRVQAEVDASLRKHRTSPSQTVAEVFASLTIDDWESEFPSVELGLRESIRITMVGTAFRRNVSDGDVPIGDTGEVVPRDAFTLYMPDDAHMDPAVYSNPTKFDPGRYLPDRAEDKKVPLAYLGWGAGRHPCLGMRFAKLEMSMITAIFAAMFDWELVDVEGTRLTEPPVVDRQKASAHKPNTPVRLRYTVRQH